MKTLDKYIAKQFLFNLLMLYVVVSTLFVLLDLIVNFDEFAQAAQKQAGGVMSRAVSMVAGVVRFYWPQLLMLYVYVAGLLPVGAAGFTFAALVRNRELVAMLAGGVSLRRVMLPIVALTLGVNALLILDREVILPPLAERLVEGHSSLRGKDTRSIKLRFVMDGNGSLFTTPKFDAEEGTMLNLTILLRNHGVQEGVFGRAVARVTADRAVWDAAKGGWTLEMGLAVYEPEVVEGKVKLLSRKVEEVKFIKSDLDPQTILLREREHYRQLLSSRQLGALMSKGLIVDTRELKRLRHSRWALPVVNMLILLMGVPFFLLRAPGPLLVPTIRAAAMCVPAWAGGFVMHQLSPETLPPAAVAWLPVALYLPVAYYLMESVET